jgi:biotin carboxyl carrier protein
MNMTVMIEGRTFVVEIPDLQARPIIAIVDGEQIAVMPAKPAPQLNQNGQHNAPAVVPVVAPPVTGVARARSGNSQAVLAPIPGVITALAIKPGEHVTSGQELCTLEAMKMQNIIRAPHDGVIAVIHVAVGQHVRHHEALMEYAPK